MEQCQRHGTKDDSTPNAPRLVESRPTVPAQGTAARARPSADVLRIRQEAIRLCPSHSPSRSRSSRSRTSSNVTRAVGAGAGPCLADPQPQRSEVSQR